MVAVVMMMVVMTVMVVAMMMMMMAMMMGRRRGGDRRHGDGKDGERGKDKRLDHIGSVDCAPGFQIRAYARLPWLK